MAVHPDPLPQEHSTRRRCGLFQKETWLGSLCVALLVATMRTASYDRSLTGVYVPDQELGSGFSRSFHWRSHQRFITGDYPV